MHGERGDGASRRASRSGRPARGSVARYELPELRAGATAPARVALRNDGTATWRSRGEIGVQLSYHWLDDRGNPIVWDGSRSDVRTAGRARRGGRARRSVRGRRSRPAATGSRSTSSRSFRFWFAEVGSSCARRLSSSCRASRAAAGGPSCCTAGQRRATARARRAGRAAGLGARRSQPRTSSQARCRDPDWSRRVLDAHAEGFAAVGAAIETRDRSLAPWPPGGGRNPAFAHPLLFPSLLERLTPSTHLELPSYSPPRGIPDDLREPWIFEGRTGVRFRA